MALKFGNLFDDVFGEGFKSSIKKAKGEIGKLGEDLQDSLNVKDATTNIKAFKTQLSLLDEVASEAATKIATLKEELDKEVEGSEAYAKKLKELNAAKDEAEILEHQALKIQKDLNKESTKFSKTFKTVRGLFNDTNKTFQGLGQQISGFAGDAIGKIFEVAIPGLGPIAGEIGSFLGDRIMDSFKQIVELNESLIKLQRGTGGLITATKLGYDAFGNAKIGMKSLATTTLEANVSVEQFSDAMKDLASGGGFGQIAGAAQDLDKSADALRNYGIEAARIEKLYGAKIGPVVNNLFKNFNTNIKDATKLAKEGAEKAVALGLSADDFIENLKEATDLSGELYFKTNEELTRMAGLATILGTKVSIIAKGISKMSGLTDLFKQQQEKAALGLRNVGASLSKIYALRATGKQEEAVKVEFQAFAKDLLQQGFVNKGQVSQQGIATLQAAGASQDQIQALQRMASEAEKAGVALDKAFDPSKLSKQEKTRLDAVQKASMTISEQMNIAFGKLKQAFVDPLAKVFGPIMSKLADLFSMVADALTPILNILGGLVDVILYPFEILSDEIMSIVNDVFGPLKDAFGSMSNIFGGFFDTIKSISKFVVKFLMVPFRIVGKIVGGIAKVFADLYHQIADVLAPAFSWISDLFNSGSDMLDSFIDTVGEVIGGIAKFIGKILGGAFKAIGWVVGKVADGFKWLWDAISPLVDGMKDLWGAVVDFYEWLFGKTEAETKTESGPDTQGWKELLGDVASQVQNPNNPSLSTKAVEQSQTAYTKGSDLEKQNELAVQKAFMAPVTNVNVEVDPMFGNKQSIKSPR